MAGLGPKIKQPIIGRHGGEFYTFGDYSVNLFKNYEIYICNNLIYRISLNLCVWSGG